MNQTFTYLKTVIAALLFPALLFGQADGDYRSAATGNWGTLATWERYDGGSSSWLAAPSAPTSADGVITIRAGHTVTIAAAVTADQVVVDAGGTLNNNTVSANLTLNDGAGDDLTVNGTYLLRALNTLVGSGVAPSVLVNGTFDWFSGTLQVATSIANGGILNLDLAFDKNLQTTLTNNGTVNWTTITSSGSIAFNNGSFINNGTINELFGINAGFTLPAGTGSFVNNGIFNKTTVRTFFNNTVSFTNSASGTLKGIGTYNLNNFTVTNVGNIAPGNSPGLMTTSAYMVTTESPTIRIEILDGSGPGTGHDKLDFNTAATNVDVSGTSLIVTENTSSPLQAYTIIENTGGGVITGNFAAVTIPLGYSITYTPGVSTTVVVTKLAVTLPAVWGDFTAIARNNQVNLTWKTLQENNVSDFVVEYSTNGRDFSPLTTVAAAGNSSSVQQYQYTHNLPDVQRTNYYRIRQTDMDGKSAISAVRLVKFGKAGLVAVTALPNPVRDRLQLSVQADHIRVVLTDLSGRTIETRNLQPGNHELNMSQLAPGMYQLVVFQNDKLIETQKIMKQ
ncbi:MAG: T9SS type A sorting domain-containing protein [Sphingobacteriales bacterium]|nr:T9SS type A sorting domain-containing protein [Sphingobacteriales bacterium]